MKLEEILYLFPFHKMNHGKEDVEVTGIETDHRNIKQGDVFICISGFTVDGHDFAPFAVENGAVAVISEKEIGLSVPTIIVPDTKRALAMIATAFYDYPTNNIPLIGVTGTNGKTTVTYLLESIFQAFEMKTGLIGTIQMKIGKDVYPVHNTTPDALFLQKMFRKMVDEQVETAIMEVSSHALDLKRVYGCEFDIAIFTNLTQDHLDYHTSMEDYLRAKSLLFSQLGNDYSSKKKYAILNKDDSHSELLEKSTAHHVITYGCVNAAMVRATNIELKLHETKFTMHTPRGTVEIKSNLIGMFNVYNMLAASAAALAMNIPLEIIQKALTNMAGVNGRFEQVLAGQNYAVIVDYAHTPDSLENVLKTIKQFSTKKVIVVVGCGGDRDRKKRPLMAKAALNYADWAIFTSDNPRTEDPNIILNDMTQSLQQTHYEVIENRKEAIYQAISKAEKDDIILIAGKGHETYQEINGVRYDFDDRIVAREAIQQKEK